jgi:hypothetical protein
MIEYSLSRGDSSSTWNLLKIKKTKRNQHHPKKIYFGWYLGCCLEANHNNDVLLWWWYVLVLLLHIIFIELMVGCACFDTAWGARREIGTRLCFHLICSLLFCPTAAST